MLSTKRYDSPAPPQNTLPHQPPRLCFFISRSNGNLVPLIPADELPYSVRLNGVQRAMKMENTCGMHHVGNFPFTGQYFRPETDTMQHAANLNFSNFKSNMSATKHFLAPDAMIRKTVEATSLPASSPTADQPTTRQLPASATASTWRRNVDASSATAQAAIDAIIASDPRPQPRTLQTAPRPQHTHSPSSSGGSTPEQSDKVYCTHWIRHGECDYIQQGCRYKHEMPDRATLAGIGFRTVPRWWQERVAVQLGHSALATVGPALKPSEWMQKKRRSSKGSCSDDDSESESESESEAEEEEEDKEGDKEEEKAKESLVAEPAKDIVAKQSATVMEPVVTKADEVPVLLPTKKTESLPKVETPTPIAVLASSSEASRKPSLTGDLIDFSPVALTCKTTTSSVSAAISANNTKPGSAKTPAPATQKVETKRSPTPPRKIFVPAGESKGYHIADARKHALSVEPAKYNSVDMERPCRFSRPAVHEAAATSTSKHQPKPLMILKRPDVSCSLMASVHAPVRVVSSSSSSPPPHTGRQSSPAKTSKHRGRKPRSGSESPSVSRASPKGEEARATGSKDREAKLSLAKDKPTVPSACRPRRPAGGAAKVARSKGAAKPTAKASEVQHAKK